MVSNDTGESFSETCVDGQKNKNQIVGFKGTPFENYVNEQKKQRLEKNFSETFLSKPHEPLPDEVARYLAGLDLPISPEVLRNAECIARGRNNNGIIPDVSDDGIHKVLEHAPTNFASPLVLTEYVSDLIKKNMSYNSMSTLLVIWHEFMYVPQQLNKSFIHQIITMFSEFQLDYETQQKMYEFRTREELVQFISELLGKSQIIPSDSQLRDMHVFIEAHIGEIEKKYFSLVEEGYFRSGANTPGEMLDLMRELKLAIEKRDYVSVNSLVINNYDLYKLIMIDMVDQKYDFYLYHQHTIEDYLDNIKSGVCRHYSLIAKKMYEKLKDRINPPVESELIYVGNAGKRHAYNLLMWSDPNESDSSKYHQQYIDITNYDPTQIKTLYRSSGELGVYGDPGEIWASTADGNEQSVERSI